MAEILFIIKTKCYRSVERKCRLMFILEGEKIFCKYKNYSINQLENIYRYNQLILNATNCHRIIFLSVKDL